jgi:hypothetical protein
MCKRARPYRRAVRCGFGGRGVTKLILPINMAYVELKVRNEWQGILASHILQSKKPDPKRIKTYNQIKMCMYVYGEYGKVDTRLGMGARYYHTWWILWWLVDRKTTPFCMILSLICFEGMTIHDIYMFFHLDLHGSNFFLIYIAMPLCDITWREILTHTVECFVHGIDGWYNANFYCRSIARETMMCTWILMMRAWNEFSQGSQKIDKAQCNNKQHISIRCSTRTSYGFGKNVAYQRGALQDVF